MLFQLKEMLYSFSSISKPPASLFMGFRAIVKKNKGLLNTGRDSLDGRSDDQDVGTVCNEPQVWTACYWWTKGWFASHVVWNGTHEISSATHNSMQFKTYELITSEIFHLVFLDYAWLQVTEIMKSETVDKENYCMYLFLICLFTSFLHPPLPLKLKCKLQRARISVRLAHYCILSIRK